MHLLTDRQREILGLAAQGLRDSEISARIGITPHTVRLHLMVIRQHLKARNTTHAVAIALTNHLISLEDRHEGSKVFLDGGAGPSADGDRCECGGRGAGEASTDATVPTRDVDA